MAVQNLSQSNPFFLAAGPLPVAILHLEQKIRKILKIYIKKDVNRNSHIASLPISQSSYFKEVRCLILASSQRKIRGYIEFYNFMSR